MTKHTKRRYINEERGSYIDEDGCITAPDIFTMDGYIIKQVRLYYVDLSCPDLVGYTEKPPIPMTKRWKKLNKRKRRKKR